MSLPIFQPGNGLPGLIQTFSLLQTAWANLINPNLANVANNSLILKNVTLATGDNTLNHKLGHKLNGWVLTRQRAGVTVYDKQDTNPNPSVTLILNSSGNAVVDIEVF